jgi:hypothetical protein
MPDGKRKRRHSTNVSKRRWYARYRALRFANRFGCIQKLPESCPQQLRQLAELVFMPCRVMGPQPAAAR